MLKVRSALCALRHEVYALAKEEPYVGRETQYREHGRSLRLRLK